MDVIIMAEITSLIKELLASTTRDISLAHLTVTPGEVFSWNYTACAIKYSENMPHAKAYLLHEFGHALLHHTTYTHDVDLIRMERAAWDKALQLAKNYHITISNDTIEKSIDTYRDWLHSRSLCPQCSSTGIQLAPFSYACLACHSHWCVNEARTCALRRYVKKHSL